MDGPIAIAVGVIETVSDVKPGAEIVRAPPAKNFALYKTA